MIELDSELAFVVSVGPVATDERYALGRRGWMLYSEVGVAFVPLEHVQVLDVDGLLVVVAVEVGSRNRPFLRGELVLLLGKQARLGRHLDQLLHTFVLPLAQTRRLAVDHDPLGVHELCQN